MKFSWVWWELGRKLSWVFSFCYQVLLWGKIIKASSVFEIGINSFLLSFMSSLEPIDFIRYWIFAICSMLSAPLLNVRFGKLEIVSARFLIIFVRFAIIIWYHILRLRSLSWCFKMIISVHWKLYYREN